MSGYSEMYAAQAQARFMDKWAPREDLPDLTEENLRWNVARARYAEDKVSRFERALGALKGLMTERSPV